MPGTDIMQDEQASTLRYLAPFYGGNGPWTHDQVMLDAEVTQLIAACRSTPGISRNEIRTKALLLAQKFPGSLANPHLSRYVIAHVHQDYGLLD